MFGLCLLEQDLEGLVPRRVAPNIREPRDEEDGEEHG